MKITAAISNYTKAEVAQRNGKGGEDVWIIINGSVYDVTDYVHHHPGGEDAILDWAGKDATKEFESIGHSSEAIRELKAHKIGVLIKTDANNNKTDSIKKENNDVTAKNGFEKQKKKRAFLLFCA